MGIKSKLIHSSGKAATMIAKEVVGTEAIDILVKVGSELYEQQKHMIKIPDLKDVHKDEAQSILKEKLGLNPVMVVAHPKIAFAFESENEVVYAEPRFGSRVDPGTIVKLYYLTQEVIAQSKELSKFHKEIMSLPTVIGLHVVEAREDLENIGLRVSQKLETPHEMYANKTEGQVTRLTYSDDRRVGKKIKTGDRIWVYYVDEQVIEASKHILIKKEQRGKEVIRKIAEITKEASDSMLLQVENTKEIISKSYIQTEKATKDVMKSVMTNFKKKPKE